MAQVRTFSDYLFLRRFKPGHGKAVLAGAMSRDLRDFIKKVGQKGTAFSMVLDGKVICCMGFVLKRRFSCNDANLWVLLPSNIERDKFSIIKSLKRVLALAREQYQIRNIRVLVIENCGFEGWLFEHIGLEQARRRVKNYTCPGDNRKLYILKG